MNLITFKAKYTFGGDRTHGQQLKRLSLYRLSYEGFILIETVKEK